MKKFIAVGAIVLALAGCSQINSGTIVNKVIEPAQTILIPIVHCTPVGKVTVCTTTYIPSYDDQDWRFDLEKGDQEGYVYVTEQTFNQYEIGDFYKSPDADDVIWKTR